MQIELRRHERACGKGENARRAAERNPEYLDALDHETPKSKVPTPPIQRKKVSSKQIEKKKRPSKDKMMKKSTE